MLIRLCPRCNSYRGNLSFMLPKLAIIRLAFVCFIPLPIWSTALDAWPTNSAEMYAANSRSIDSIQEIVNTAAEGAQLPHLKVGDFRFVCLEPGRVHLVATIDSSGRDLYFALAIVAPPDVTPRLTVLNSAPPHLLANEILDLEGKGVSIIVAKQLVGLYEGADSAPIFWHKIYKMKAGTLEDVSTQFPSYYQRTILPTASFVEGALTARRSDEKQKLDIYLAESAFLQFKYQRAILHHPMAGLDVATKWRDASDTQLKMLAIETFAEIDRPEAISSLRTLSNNANYVVSQAAKNALAAKRQKR